MAMQAQILLSEAGREGCMTVQAHIEIDSLAAYRLKVAWSFALSALAVANDCPKHTFAFRMARLQAQRAIDIYFEEVESSLNRI
jgi:hypothetical protein